ncbi:MAG: hypothetical protein N2C14_21935 [Planctomycetales bacterium]
MAKAKPDWFARNFKNKKFKIAGKFANKSEFMIDSAYSVPMLIRHMQGVLVDDVTADLDFLIVGETGAIRANKKAGDLNEQQGRTSKFSAKSSSFGASRPRRRKLWRSSTEAQGR